MSQDKECRMPNCWLQVSEQQCNPFLLLFGKLFQKCRQPFPWYLKFLFSLYISKWNQGSETIIQTIWEWIKFCFTLRMIYEDYWSSWFFWSFENTILPFASLSKKKLLLCKCLLTLMVVCRTPWLGILSATHKENGGTISKTIHLVQWAV